MIRHPTQSWHFKAPSEQKIHVLRAIKIISIILSLRIVIRSAMEAGFTMKFYYTGRDY